MISSSLQVSVDIRKEDDVFYIGCDALDVHSQGNTEEQANSASQMIDVPLPLLVANHVKQAQAH